ncbi:MAG TPA: bile acid:sodium symporter family protein [Burkholderiaceae bacterium]|nr:bile acid:sodium symporter family protein [Burkholderiaceae bacterium]
MARPNYLPDNFTLSLVTVVTLASVLPASGPVARFFEVLTSLAIGLLFFLHGAKLTREALVGGVLHWRLHVLVFACTFVLFPVLGLVLRPVLEPLVTPALYSGVLFLCMLPATVQSAIALVSIARGNVPAAICSASASTLIGVFFTPVLVGLLVVSGGSSSSSLDSISRILLQLMLPFFAGHMVRPWISGWVKRHASKLKYVDQGSILLVIYTAFSAAVINGLWQQVPATALLGLLVVCAILLALVLTTTVWTARRLGFSKADEVAIVFCGSQKSLASGIPMAKILFASSTVGAIVLPLMLFHQMQLMVCSMLARRYATRPEPSGLDKALET